MQAHLHGRAEGGGFDSETEVDEDLAPFLAGDLVLLLGPLANLQVQHYLQFFTALRTAPGKF